MAKDFRQWMKEVDIALEQKIGLSHLDLPDMPFWDMWHDGVTPKGAASRTIKAAKEE